MTMMGKRILAGLVAVAALLVAAGCSSNPSVAATVNGEVVAEAAVQKAAGGMLDIVQDSGDFTGLVLESYVYQIALGSVLGEMGVTITDAMRDEWWMGSIDPASTAFRLWTDPRTKAGIAGYIDIQIVNTMLQNGQLDVNEVQIGRAHV
jgi:hypothetical protein